ncbi:MAG TPA: hypothetical protein VL326_22195, partial [Kofleriaceae bacterium]|nr:hypothetical protein [Kofleriaceae bacterium]
MRILALGCVVAGCGRFGFEARTGDRDFDAGAIDAAAPVCATQPTPSMITVRGATFRYTGFMNTTAAIPGANVQATDRDNGTVIATTTSDNAGMYSLSYATGGSARRLLLEYSEATYEKTT